MDDDFERHLDSDTLSFIRGKARQLAGRYGFPRHEVEDIQQSLILDCLERLPRFNPDRGGRANFTRLIVKRGVATLIEAQKSCSRGGGVGLVSLDSPVNHDSGASALRDVISEHDHRGIGRHTNLMEQSLIARLDVERAIADLPADLKRICLLLVVIDRVAQVAAVAGVSRATLHRRMRVIRAAFVEKHLSDSIPEIVSPADGAAEIEGQSTQLPAVGGQHGVRSR